MSDEPRLVALLGRLPAQFLALVLLNVILVGGLFWLEDERNTARERVLVALFEACGEPHQLR